jgi:hypothetical protein
MQSNKRRHQPLRNGLKDLKEPSSFKNSRNGKAVHVKEKQSSKSTSAQNGFAAPPHEVILSKVCAKNSLQTSLEDSPKQDQESSQQDNLQSDQQNQEKSTSPSIQPTSLLSMQNVVPESSSQMRFDLKRFMDYYNEYATACLV